MFDRIKTYQVYVNLKWNALTLAFVSLMVLLCGADYEAFGAMLISYLVATIFLTLVEFVYKSIIIYRSKK